MTFEVLVLLSAVYLWLFWYLYVLIMGFYRAWLAKKLTPFALALAFPALLVGYVVDLVANWTFATLWFREWPKRPLELVTDRLARYLGMVEDCRKKRHADWLCRTLLDYFDPAGVHCK